MSPLFEIRKNFLVIKVKGELDHFMADQIRLLSDTYLEGTRIHNVIFDFKDTTFMDSSGIGMIMGRYKQVKRLNGRIYAVHVGPAVERIINISGLHKLLRVARNVDEALEEK